MSTQAKITQIKATRITKKYHAADSIPIEIIV